MAAVAPSFASDCFERHDTPQGSPLGMDPSMGSVQLVPNPDFVFPARSDHGDDAPSPANRRPASMHLHLSPPPPRHRAQRQSASALPTFTFNATDTSGKDQDSLEPSSPTLNVPVTPSRAMGHRRRASEFVGGDSRFGVSTLVSTSPSKLPETLPVPGDRPATGSPSRRRGHAHRRSAAISGHDLASILQPRDLNAASHMSIPSFSRKEDDSTPAPAGPSSDAPIEDSAPSSGLSVTQPDSPLTVRPPSRPRVGFSENVEYIPRPLSTMSSDTSSSLSTVRGHSVTNSISSVISLGGVGVPAPRRSRTPPTIDLRPADPSTHKLSFDSAPPRGCEDDPWRYHGQRPHSQSAATSPSLSISLDAPIIPRQSQRKRAFLKLDRRRSEPLIIASSLEQPALSTVSLQDPVMSGPYLAHPKGDDVVNELSHKSSRRRVKDWANAFLGRRARDPRQTKSMVLSPDILSVSDLAVFSPQPMHSVGPELEPDLEPDLDAVFGQDSFDDEDSAAAFSFAHRRPDPDMLSIGSPDIDFGGSDDPSSMIDLDAALGPYGTPSMSGGRRQMHSGGFGRRGPERGHNRTYSLPTLTPFKFDRASSPVKSSMADVFEEDEDTEPAPTNDVRDNKPSANEAVESDNEGGTGIQIVDAVDDEELAPSRATEHGLGIHRVDDATVQGAALLSPMTPNTVRAKSVIDETIFEEASPIEVVEDHEEPRTSSVTKSSESSEASTILAEQCNLVPSAEPSPMSPISYTASAFSSPDYHGQHEFFDPSRLGTSTSSITDNRTVSSFGPCDHALDARTSVEDVPSLTSSRSTMMSAMHHTFPRREFSDRSGSIVSVPVETEMSERRRKRSSIVSLSKLVGAPFGDSRTRPSSGKRPQTAVPANMLQDGKKRKENRLSKLMFWRSKGEAKKPSSPQ